jgi:hypothetical protein
VMPVCGAMTIDPPPTADPKPCTRVAPLLTNWKFEPAWPATTGTALLAVVSVTEPLALANTSPAVIPPEAPSEMLPPLVLRATNSALVRDAFTAILPVATRAMSLPAVALLSKRLPPAVRLPTLFTKMPPGTEFELWVMAPSVSDLALETAILPPPLLLAVTEVTDVASGTGNEPMPVCALIDNAVPAIVALEVLTLPPLEVSVTGPALTMPTVVVGAATFATEPTTMLPLDVY